MKEELLIRFLSSFEELGKKDVEEIAKHIPVEAFPKGTILLREGEVPKACYFVLGGLVRQYQMIEGVEKTTEFYTAKNGSISSFHFINQTPSDSYLVCLEDCILIYGTRDVDASNYEKFPVLKAITGKMLEYDLNKSKEKFAHFITSSPKERYLQFLASHPDLVNRVPLHQIASYLGVTPESLSRIRKRIVSE